MNEWLELKGSEPQQGQKVLVCGPLVDVQQAEYWKHEPGVHDGDTQFVDMLESDVFPVTHWMPLPEPPQ